MKNGLKRDAFTVKNGGIFNTPILISKAEMQKILVPSRFQSIEKEPQLQYISYHNYGSYLVRVVIQNFLKKPVISTVFKADE